MQTVHVILTVIMVTTVRWIGYYSSLPPVAVNAEDTCECLSRGGGGGRGVLVYVAVCVVHSEGRTRWYRAVVIRLMQEVVAILRECEWGSKAEGGWGE